MNHNTPTIKFSMKKRVLVNKGLARNWTRSFSFTDDIRVPEGWESSLEINGRMVRFSFARSQNGRKIPNGECIIVIDKCSRDEALNGKAGATERWYLMPVMSVLRPIKEDGQQMPDVVEYLRENCLATFNREDKDRWVKEGKLKIN